MGKGLLYTYHKRSYVSDFEDDNCSWRRTRPRWTVAGMITASVLICLTIRRSKVNCGKSLAMKLGQALTWVERGCRFFQARSLQPLWSLTHCLVIHELIGPWCGLVPNPPFKLSPSCWDLLRLLAPKSSPCWVAERFVWRGTEKCFLLSVRYGRFDPLDEMGMWIAFTLWDRSALVKDA